MKEFKPRRQVTKRTGMKVTLLGVLIELSLKRLRCCKMKFVTE